MRGLSSIISLGFLMGLLNSCQMGDEPPIAVDKMQQILRDIHLSEAENQQTGRDSANNPLPRNKQDLAESYATVYDHYNISKEDFNNSMDWYRKHPALLDSIYTRLIPEMSVLQAQAETLEKATPPLPKQDTAL